MTDGARIELVGVTEQAGNAARVDEDDVFRVAEVAFFHQVDHAGETLATVNGIAEYGPGERTNIVNADAGEPQSPKTNATATIPAQHWRAAPRHLPPA